MSNGNSGPVRNTPVARNRYSEGQILQARDLERESDYFMVRDRQHNALAHGPGILTGLQLTAYEMGTETAVLPGTLTQPTELDLWITPGAAIDTMGRFVIVPKRARLQTEFAKRGGDFAAGTYRVELLYSHADRELATSTGNGNGNRSGGGNGDGCAPAAASNAGKSRNADKLAEAYRIELIKYDPAAPMPELARGAVLDGPVDDPTARAPVVLGLVDWNGANYVGYSATGRVYAPVTAQRVQAPDGRAELNLEDTFRRLTFRTAALPPADAEDPFTPVAMTDRFRVDEDGNVWVPAEVGVGSEGVRFRRDKNPVSPEDSKWRVHTRIGDPGADYGKDAAGTALKVDDPYVEGRRELRVQFQRDGLNKGRQRIVVGHVDQNGDDFQPALVVYDRLPSAGGTGSATVEVWGDLFVRGTAWLHAAALRPPDENPAEEMDLLLRQLAGPFAGAFRLFLTSDEDWLNQFASVIANRIQSDPTLGPQLVNLIVPVLIASPTFQQAIAAQLNATIDAKVAAGVSTALAAALSDQAKMLTAAQTMAQALDVGMAGSNPLPADPGAMLMTALIRRLLRRFPQTRDEIHAAMEPVNEQAAVKNFFNSWINDIPAFPPDYPPIP